MIGIGTNENDIGQIMVGSTAINEVYVGSTKVWPLNITPPPPRPKYTLTLVNNNPTRGEVWINNTDSVSSKFTSGASVTVHASAFEGNTFNNWRRDDTSETSTSSNYTFSMPSSDLAITASFNVAPVALYQLTVNTQLINSNIAPSESDAMCWIGTNASTKTSRFEANTSVTLHASSNSKYEFKYWKRSDISTTYSTKDITITMPSKAVTFTAIFEEVIVTESQPTLTVKCNEYCGFVWIGDNYTTKSIQAKPGTEIIVHCEPDDEFVFSHWKNSLNNNIFDSADYRFTMPNNDVVLTGIFEEDELEYRVELTYYYNDHDNAMALYGCPMYATIGVAGYYNNEFKGWAEITDFNVDINDTLIIKLQKENNSSTMIIATPYNYQQEKTTITGHFTVEFKTMNSASQKMQISDNVVSFDL